jgi:uncharacterized protein YidB (DUF937 family)
MGLFDNLGLGNALKGALGQVEAAALPALINGVLAQTQYHDLNGLVAALQKGGLNTQVQSWLGPGANLPITEDQLKAVLMAQYLPDIVDKASPNGTLKPAA